MDDDTLRRGRPTLHVVYGDGIAILAGDGLHAEAFTMLAREPATGDPAIMERQASRRSGSSATPRVRAAWSEARRSICRRPDRRLVTPSRSMPMASGICTRCKTGALIRASAMSGAIMGGADAERVAAIERYAREVGLAFQIIDDVLDVEGDPASLGKTAGKDAASEKPTYPALFGLEQSRALATNACGARTRRWTAQASETVCWQESPTGSSRARVDSMHRFYVFPSCPLY